MIALLSGCAPPSPSNEAPVQSRIFSRVEIIGKRGVGVGELNKPRSVAVDAQDNLYVADMTGRVQKFSSNGVFLLSWQLTQTDLGKPKGMCRDRDGDIIVIEPHYQRVNHFTPDGKLVARWGVSGTNAGQLKFPRAVAVNSRGEIFVSEYGVVERVQKFALLGNDIRNARPHPDLLPQERENRSPAREEARDGAGSDDTGVKENARMLSPLPGGEGQGEGGRSYKSEIRNPGTRTSQEFSELAAPKTEMQFLASFGHAGTGPGELNRPEGLFVDAQDRVYVADSCNHRIQIFSNDGRFLRAYGKAGAGSGELSYPYDICVDAAGRQYVCEFGNSRIQIFDANDQPIEITWRSRRGTRQVRQSLGRRAGFGGKSLRGGFAESPGAEVRSQDPGRHGGENSKSEIRNPKEARNPKSENGM